MKCYECKWLDRSIVLTSIPPQYRCTLGFGSHYADHECEYDFMPIVRCKDCRYLNRKVQLAPKYYLCTKHTGEHGIQLDDYCSWGERKEDAESALHHGYGENWKEFKSKACEEAIKAIKEREDEQKTEGE